MLLRFWFWTSFEARPMIKIKRFGLIEVTEEHLADGRSSLRRATSDERRNSGFTVVSVVVVLKRPTLKWPLTDELGCTDDFGRTDDPGRIDDFGPL